jgi:hypothetical protein
LAQYQINQRNVDKIMRGSIGERRQRASRFAIPSRSGGRSERSAEPGGRPLPSGDDILMNFPYGQKIETVEKTVSCPFPA